VPQESGEPDPLQELLMDSAGATRGLAPVSSGGPKDLKGWTTVQRVLVVKRGS